MVTRLERIAVRGASRLSPQLGARLAEARYIRPRRACRPDDERALLASASAFTIPTTTRSPRWRARAYSLSGWRWGSGPAVLLVHGWEGRGAQLGAFVPPLVAAGLSVVMFDALGHGDSPGCRLYVTDLAGAVTDATSAVGGLHAVIAHSLGATAWLLAGGRRVGRAVLIAPVICLDDSIARFASVHGLDNATLHELDTRIAAHAGLDRAHRTLVPATRAGSTLIVHDRDDREVPIADSERLAGAWPAVQLCATRGLGHVSLLRDPQVVAKAVAFISAPTGA